MSKTKLPKPLNLIRIWADWNGVPYKYDADVLETPMLHRLYFHKFHKYHVTISEAVDDVTTVNYFDRRSGYHEWMDPYEAIAKLKEVIGEST